MQVVYEILALSHGILSDSFSLISGIPSIMYGDPVLGDSLLLSSTGHNSSIWD